MIIADNNLTNSDWIKSARWDLPFTTVEGFAKFKGISVEDTPFLISELGKFVELPSYNAAPEQFKSEVRNYLGSVAKAMLNGVEFKYSEDQPRDENGRFASSDSSGYDAGILARYDTTTPPPVIGAPGVWQSKLIPPGSVASVVKAKTDFIKSKGYEVRDIDYLQIAADPNRGKVIADMFDTLPSYDEAAVPAYEALRSEVREQFDYLVNDMGIKVDVVEQDPYRNGSEMMADLENNGHIAVLSTASTGGHPFFTNEENDMFRAVHDVFGHAGAGTNFDRNGEEASFVSHFQMFSPLAARALATETRGQNSWLTYSGNDTFAEQKLALLPEEMTLPYPKEGQQDAQALVKSWKFTGDDEGWNEDRFGVVNTSLGRYRFNQTATKSFNPDQERDERGRWTSGASYAPLPIDAAWQANFDTPAGASARANMKDGEFTPERQALHEQIIRKAFEGVSKPEGQPTVYFLGGGAASGKSTAIEDGTLGVPTADSGLAVHIDPDALKEELPEYRDMARAKDSAAAEYVHEESSYLANSIAAIAREQGYNVVLDGVNSGMKVAGKIEDYRADGYKVEGHYVTRPTEEAVLNNQGRFQRALDKLDAGVPDVYPRYVPADRVIAGHQEVSRNFEALAPLFDRATLTDMTGNVRTTVGETVYGQPFTPTADTAPLYQSFLEKGK